jgi:hypothetical protein
MDSLESLYKLAEMTPSRLARNQQLAYRLMASWRREDVESAARAIISQSVLVTDATSGYGVR